MSEDEKNKIDEDVPIATETEVVAEDVLAEQKKLKDSKALIEAIVENVPLMIFLKEATNLRFVLFNRAGEELLGYDRSELLGKNDMDFFTSEQAAHFMAKDREVLDNELGLLDIPEEPIQTAKKGERVLHTRKVCIRDVDGNIKYLLGISEDITERKRFETTLRKSERLGAIGEIAAGIAHDFNNALQGIIGCIDMAMTDTTLQPETRADIATAKQSALDAATRIKQLQRFAGTIREPDKFEIIEVKSVLEDAVAQTKGLWKDKAQQNGLMINVEMNCQDNLTFSGNSGELRTVFFNLIKNSIEAMPQGGAITIEAKNIDQEVFINFTDNGVGMDEETKLRVFQPFFSTKGFEQGRGLGLSGVYSIVREHGGSIEIKKTAPGQGTTFEIRLPYAKKQIVTEVQDSNVECITSARVLWVDDEELIRKIGKRMIERLGHKIDLASNGNEALERLETNQYDLLITDVGMPGMSGFQLIESIKGKYPEMQIAVLTGWGDTITSEEKKERGVECVIGKPIELEEIKSLIREVMQMKHISSSV